MSLVIKYAMTQAEVHDSHTSISKSYCLRAQTAKTARDSSHVHHESVLAVLLELVLPVG